jgi:hypothetical protein
MRKALTVFLLCFVASMVKAQSMGDFVKMSLDTFEVLIACANGDSVESMEWKNGTGTTKPVKWAGMDVQFMIITTGGVRSAILNAIGPVENVQVFAYAFNFMLQNIKKVFPFSEDEEKSYYMYSPYIVSVNIITKGEIILNLGGANMQVIVMKF